VINSSLIEKPGVFLNIKAICVVIGRTWQNYTAIPEL
jgi:hypothetical protein